MGDGLRQNAGSGNYTFDLSANTTNNSGVTLTTCVSSGGCPTYTSGGTASRVVPNLNAGLIAAATAYAGGDSTQLNWALNDMETGTRPANSGGVDFNITNYIAPSTGWLTTNNAICATYAGTVPLQFILYEGGLSYNWLSTANGNTLGLTTQQIFNVNAYLLAFFNSSHFTTATNYFLSAFKAMSCAKYPSQYDDLGSLHTNWFVTYGNIYNYGVGNGSFGSFDALSHF